MTHYAKNIILNGICYCVFTQAINGDLLFLLHAKLDHQAFTCNLDQYLFDLISAPFHDFLPKKTMRYIYSTIPGCFLLGLLSSDAISFHSSQSFHQHCKMLLPEIPNFTKNSN